MGATERHRTSQQERDDLRDAHRELFNEYVATSRKAAQLADELADERSRQRQLAQSMHAKGFPVQYLAQHGRVARSAVARWTS